MADETDVNVSLLKDVRCKICNEIKDGVVIATKDEFTKALICSNCMSKIKAVA